MGTEWPDDNETSEQPLSLEAQENLKYGTAEDNLLRLGPVSDAMDLVGERDSLDESESVST